MRFLMFILLAGLLNSSFVLGMARAPELKGKLVMGTVIRDLETGEEKFLTPNNKNYRDVYGLLSSDESLLLYVVRNIAENIKEEDRYELRTVNTQLGEDKLWIKSKNPPDSSWSPDGKMFVIKLLERRSPLIVQYETGVAWEIKINDKGYSSVDPYWAKDGASLYYGKPEMDDSSVYKIVKISFDGREIGFIATSYKFDMDSISPNEKWVAAIPHLDEDLHLIKVGVDKRVRFEKTRKFESMPFWSPDSKWVGVQLTRNTQQQEFVAYHLETKRKKELFYLPTDRVITSIISWWTPPTQAAPDCEKIITKMLGPGRPLNEILNETK